MDHESLRTASTYLNNLLLARGLLRNSTNVDFVKPSKDSRAQIINLVHDLILREDRDRDNREHVAITLRNLRGTDARKDVEIAKLKAKTEESARAAVQAQTAQRTAEGEAKRVEKAMKTLQEQNAKIKTSLAQVKTQCLNDVRKRDLELSRLKTHLQGQQRGVKVVAPSATIVGGSANGAARGRRSAEPAHDLDDPAYRLTEETTEFLTQLSQSLSDENDNLIALVRAALATMRDVLGLPSHDRSNHPDSAIGSLASNEDAHNKHSQPEIPPLTPYETLAANMEECLTQLRTILSNPNFVTIEEVEVREEEITRLREGWEHMEQRWRDALCMMDGWRKRVDTGDTINIEDLRKGMSLVSPERPRKTQRAEMEPEQSFVDMDDASEDAAPDMQDDDVEEPSILPEPTPQHSSPVARTRSSVKSSPKRKRDVLEPPDFFDLRPRAGHKAAPPSPSRQTESDLEPVLEEEEESELNGYEESESTPHMTVEEKLRAAQAEAEEAAAAAAARQDATTRSQVPDATQTDTHITTRRSRKSEPRLSFGGLEGAAAADEELDDTLGKLPSSPVKKTKIRGRPKRRKSTLSGAELEELLMSAEGLE
ncbi:hypothetical protein LTR08_006242 [Meristemomyces frigidus]|nr:hypothetical protein LTR08_006242 [Meristemomyces frigidus]